MVISRFIVLKDFLFPVVLLAIQSMNGKREEGLGTEAVRLVTTFAFEKVALHRVEAYVSPRNSGSIKVLEKSGYYPRRIARKLLYINGVWEDHYIYAIIEDDF